MANIIRNIGIITPYQKNKLSDLRKDIIIIIPKQNNKTTIITFSLYL